MHIHIEGEEINIGIKIGKNVKRTISFKNGRMCRSEHIYAEILKDRIEKPYKMLSNIINQSLNGHPVDI